MRVVKVWFALLLVAVSLSLSGCGSSGSGVAAPAPEFLFAANAVDLSLQAGSTAQLTVVATPLNGFTGTVNVTLSGLPAGVTASPTTLTLAPNASQVLTLSAASSAAAASATLTLTGTSGTLTHTTAVSLTVTAAPPPADFTLSATPATLSLTGGATGAQVSVLATAVNAFSGTVAVSLSGLPAGVTAAPTTLSLTPGTAQAITLTAAASAAASTATVTFTGTAGTLTHNATVALTVSAAPAPTGADIATYHYDNARDGLNTQETLLTLANVNASSFGLRGVYPVDGKVDAQPLYLGGLKLSAGPTNVLFVATEHDSVYALNAATGAQIWKTSVLGSGETTSDPRNCNQISPEIGITSTPVIDRSYGSHGAIFVIGMTKDSNGGYHHRLHALDLTTGAELAGSPTEITATYPGTGAGSKNGTVFFDPGQYAERVGLLLLNGTVYTGWTSHCDIEPYTGWVMGYSESTLKQTTVLNLTPNGSEGSLWMSGFGLAADADGSIYFLDANGTVDTGLLTNGYPDEGDFGNAIVKLSTNNGLAVADFFEPYNTVAESNADVDLGAGGAMLLPDVADNAGTVHHLLVGAGKDGNLYVANRDFLGKFNEASADNHNLYQEVPGALPNGVWSGPAFFNNTVFYAGVNDVLKAYTVSNALLSTAPASVSATSFGYPGATPSVSSNGSQNAIVWAVESGTGSPAVLHAYDATNLAHELYNSKQAANNRDAFGNGNKFITPVVSNGMVFVGTPSGVAVFGLLP